MEQLTEHQLNILQLLKIHEDAISQLYASYSNKYQEYGQFWSTLSKEELTHASWIEKLTKMVKDGKIYFDGGRFNLEAIKSSLAELKRALIESKGELPLIKALSTAYYFEIALIERKFFEVFEEDSVELKHTLMNLSKETQDHQKRIKEVFEKERVK